MVAIARSFRRSEASLPWTLLLRLGEGKLSEEDLDALTPLLWGQPVESRGWCLPRPAPLPARPSRRRQRPGVVNRLMASLTFDSVLEPQVSGARALVASGRRLTYEVQGMEVDLEVTEESDGLAMLAGQVGVPTQPRRYTVELRREGATILSTTTNELGYFVLHGLDPWTYSLIVRADGEEIEITPLDL